MAAEDALSQPRGHQDHRFARPLRLGAVAVAALLLLAGDAPASSSAATRVIVHTPSGDRTFSDDDFSDPDVVSEDYILRAPATPDTTQTVNGTSVAKLLQEGGIAPSSGFLRLTRADGSWSTLTADDLKDPPPFQDGRKPVVFIDSVRVRYLRPVRDGSDDNAADNIATQDNQPLEIWLQSGNILSVKASASTDSTSTGTPVTYNVDPIGGGKDGEQYTVTWKFDDGGTATGQSVTHTFANTGSFGAVAVAQGDQGSGGASNSVVVRVGNPPQTGTGPGAGATTSPSGPATGQAGSGPGGTGTGSPTQTPGSGGATGAPGTPLPQQRDPSRRERKPRTSSSATEPVQAAPATGSGTGSGSGSGGGAGTGSGTATGAASAPTSTTSTTPTPAKAPRRKHRTPPHPAPSGPVVRGVLVSATTPTSGRQSVAGQRSGRRRISEPGGDDIAVPVTAIAVLAILGLGLWHERRTVRRGTVAPA
jgi:hypothetical protein